MIFVEVSIINLNTNAITGSYSKQFVMHGDYNAWFKLNKTYNDVIINVMKYDPVDKRSLKDCYDAKLLRVSRRDYAN